MGSVLAIVSKALFEKMVPGKEELGVVVETDQYVSANKAFDQLTPKDAIFLVTVRPPDEALWLVGILESPKKNGKAWTSAVNTVPLTDITKVLKKLELASGEGITAKKGTLGMSLQTPRVLTENDDAAIRELIEGRDPSAKKVKATQDYADAVAAGPKKKKRGEDDGDDGDGDEDIVDEAVARPNASKRAKKPAGAIVLGTLRLDNYRKPFAGSIEKLSEVQRGQLQALIDSDLDSEGMKLEEFFSDEIDEENYPLKALEWIDVVDTATNAVVGDLLIFPFGDGVVLKHGTETLFANIVQHGITPAKETTKAWMSDFAKAWWEGAPRLKVDDVGHFGFDADQIEEPDDHGPAVTRAAKPAKAPTKSAPAVKKPAAKAATKKAPIKPTKKAPAKPTKKAPKPAKKPAKKPTKKPAKKRR